MVSHPCGTLILGAELTCLGEFTMFGHSQSIKAALVFEVPNCLLEIPIRSFSSDVVSLY